MTGVAGILTGTFWQLAGVTFVGLRIWIYSEAAESAMAS